MFTQNTNSNLFGMNSQNPDPWTAPEYQADIPKTNDPALPNAIKEKSKENSARRNESEHQLSRRELNKRSSVQKKQSALHDKQNTEPILGRDPAQIIDANHFNSIQSINTKNFKLDLNKKSNQADIRSTRAQTHNPYQPSRSTSMMITRGMPHNNSYPAQVSQEDPINYATNRALNSYNFLSNNQFNLEPQEEEHAFTNVANTLSLETSEVLNQYEIHKRLHDIAHGSISASNMRCLLKGQIRTVVELITKGTLLRCMKLVEAYKVIANITRELEQDFPNKTLLHLGRANNNEAALNDKANLIFVRLVNAIQMFGDTDYLISQALEMLDSDTVTDYPFAEFLRINVYFC